MAQKPPHIILIVTDQQRYDTIRALGFPHMATPSLDRLVERGVSFTGAHVTAPSCVPSRAGLFTGYFCHNSGVFTNGDPWSPTWVGMLADRGYQCVNIGKMHTIPLDQPAGFHERFIVENKDRNRHLDKPGLAFYDEWDRYLAHRGLEKPGRESYMRLPDFAERLGAFEWPLDEDAHSDIFVGNTALWWLRQRRADAPLFLQIGFPGPHPPYDPIRRFVELYMDRTLPLPATTEEELAAQPPPHRVFRKEMIGYTGSKARGPHDAVRWLERPAAEQLHRLRAYYYANVTMIDRKVGEILDLLEELGYLENAVVVFTSDHGDGLGDHGHIQKFMMYDDMVRVPLVMWSPGRIEGGMRLDALVQHMDVAPTLLELAGVEPPAGWDALSLRPLLAGERPEIRGHVYSEHAPLEGHPMMAGPGRYWRRGEGRRDGTDMITMVRSRTHKLVHYLGRPYGELYDLETDPGERRNLWDEASWTGVRRGLLDTLREWRMHSGYTSSASALWNGGQ